MDLKTALANGIEIELLAGHIYLQLQKLFADDREASSVFGAMSEEEEQHAVILRNCSGLIGSTPVASMRIDEAIRDTQKALISRLQEIALENDNHPPTLDEAMRTCIHLEEKVEKAHERTIVNLLGTKSMLTYVTTAVEAISSLESPDHGAALYDLARKRSIVY